MNLSGDWLESKVLNKSRFEDISRCLPSWLFIMFLYEELTSKEQKRQTKMRSLTIEMIGVFN